MYISRMLHPNKTRIHSLSGGPYQDPSQVLTDAQLSTVASKTGKAKGNVTWDDVYKVAGQISNLWLQIWPLILQWKNKIPAPPASLPPPKQSGTNWGLVVGVFAGVLAI